MAKYEGKPVAINHPVKEVFDRITDIESYQTRLDQLPEEAKAKLGSVKFTGNSVIITAAPVGEIQFDVVEKRTCELMKLSAAGSPVPFDILLHFKPKGEDSSEVSTELDVDIPAMLRPMVGDKLQEAADKFSEMLQLFFKV